MTLHPGAIEAYTRAVGELGHTLAAGDAHQAEAAALVRRLVDHIDVIPGAERGKFELTAYGRLAELTALVKRPANISTVPVVAGEGFEPPTLGL